MWWRIVEVTCITVIFELWAEEVTGHFAMRLGCGLHKPNQQALNTCHCNCTFPQTQENKKASLVSCNVFSITFWELQLGKSITTLGLIWVDGDEISCAQYGSVTVLSQQALNAFSLLFHPLFSCGTMVIRASGESRFGQEQWPKDSPSMSINLEGWSSVLEWNILSLSWMSLVNRSTTQPHGTSEPPRSKRIGWICQTLLLPHAAPALLKEGTMTAVKVQVKVTKPFQPPKLCRSVGLENNYHLFCLEAATHPFWELYSAKSSLGFAFGSSTWAWWWLWSNCQNSQLGWRLNALFDEVFLLPNWRTWTMNSTGINKWNLLKT